MLEAELRTLLERNGVAPELAEELTEQITRQTSSVTQTATTREAGTPGSATPLDLGPDDPSQRYEDRGLLGKGGMGEVRRVFDRRLNRELAMKTLRVDVDQSSEATARFFAEAQVTAQLQHPSIIALHDFGRLPDGQLYFTMKEVKGRTLAKVIRDVHIASTDPDGAPETAMDGGWRPASSGWTFRRLLDAFRRVCDAVAYAHTRGVLHRDLKPHNIMVGDFGEVLVLDWGLTRAAGATAGTTSHAPVVTGRTHDTQSLTRFGAISGTPGYMAPEQALGNPALVGPASDIYALGATLYYILAGHSPYKHAPDDLLKAPPPPLPHRVGDRPDGPVIPVELRQACATAMAWDAGERLSSAEDLARAISEWLDGAQRQAQAMALVADARSLDAELAERTREAARLHATAEDMLMQVPPFAPVDAKLPAWQMQDSARALALDAANLRARRLQLLRGALTHVQDFEPAHLELADMFQAQHAAAEARRDITEVAAIEPLLREHDRGRWSPYLQGDGELDLVTNPPGASLQLFQLVEERRVMVPRLLRELGPSPVTHVRLPMGHYLVVITADGYEDVRYPVSIERQHHWDGVPEGASEPRAIDLPASGTLAPDDCYVPAGWFWSGGDPAANNSLPGQRLWLDGFVMRRFPVTIGEFMAFLNDLAARGQLDEAQGMAPQVPAWEQARGGHEKGLVLGADNQFEFPGPPEQLRWPVVLVNWAGAAAYAAWLAAREKQPWRLVAEMEHEKAARGVNGSPFPWGTQFDATFCKMRHSVSGEGRNVRASVDAFPVDNSIYGIRGLAGNVHSWCIDPYQPRGPRVVNGVPQISDGSDVRGPGAGGVHRIARGGSWRDPEANVRGAFRDSPPATFRDTAIGFRVCRPFPAASA